MEIKKDIRLHNRFDIEVKDAKTGEIKQKAYAENVILNQAWAQIMGTGNWFSHIKYGTGTGTISASRTSLFAQLGNKVAASPTYTNNLGSNYFSLRQSISILENEHVGSTLTEVGIGTNTTLCTHAMLKDMNGNTVSIVKTDTDIITVYGTVYLQPTTTSSDMANIDICRSQDNILVKHLLGMKTTGMQSPWNMLLSATMSDSVNETLISGNELAEQSYAPYISGYVESDINVANKRATWYHRIPAASGNIGGLKRYVLKANNTTAEIPAPSIIGRLNSGTQTQSTIVEQIGTGNGVLTDFSTTFPFVKSGTCVIKVDGVVASPTVYYGKPNKKDYTGFMRMRTIGSDVDKMVVGVAAGGAGLAYSFILENPFHTEFAVYSFVGRRLTIESSDDMLTWASCGSMDFGYGDVGEGVITEAHRNKRYFRFTPTRDIGRLFGAYSTDLDNYKNVRFATPPANGAVITAEYQCDCAAKDVNHVVDITVVIQLGEYTP